MTGFHNIKVKSPYSIKSIEDIKIECKPNEHGKLYVKGIVEDTVNFDTTINATSNDEIHIYESNGESDKTIFKGLVSSIKTTGQNGIYYIEIEGISGSFQLDVKEKSRSFQDTSMEYPKLIKQVIKDYSSSNFVNTIGDGISIDKPIIQYKETDWEFIKRLASQFNSVVICDIMEKSPRLYFGMPEGKSYTIEENIPYSVAKDLEAFRKAGGSSAGFNDTDFFYYEIESGEQYTIGDEISFKNKKLYVSEINAYMDKGLLKYKYCLSSLKGIYKNRIYNRKLSGASIEGEVLDVKGQLVKLHLNIDKEQTTSKAYWFPFAPPTGNVMYCMPKTGTYGRLYFPDETGDNASALGCVRKNGGGCQKTGNPDNRYFGTEHGSELEITPGAINIVGGCKEPLKLSIEDALGVTLKSHKKLKLSAGADVSFYTPKRIVISAQSQVLVKKTSMTSGLSVESEYHFLGGNVIAEGTDRTTYPPFDDEPKQAQVKTITKPPTPKPKFSLGKLLLCAVAAVAVVALSVATFGAGAVIGAALIGAAVGAAIGVGGTIAAANANGGKASLSDCLKNGIEGALVGAACGAVLGPLGMGIPGIAIGAGAGATLFLPDEVSKGINSFVSNIGKYFDKINKDFGINDPMLKDGEILVSTLAKFGWGTVEGVSFIAKTTLDAAKLDLGDIGKKLNLIDDDTYKQLIDNFGIDIENWKKVPQGFVNSAKNALMNGHKLITDPNISVDEASDIGNDILNTIFVLKGGHDLVKGIGNKAGDLGKSISNAIDDFKENSDPKLSMEGVPDGFFDYSSKIDDNISKAELNEQQKNYNKVVNGEGEVAEGGEKRPVKANIGDDGLTSEQRKEFDRRIENASSKEEADKIRFERNKISRENRELEPYESYEAWYKDVERIRRNSSQGRIAEEKSRQALKNIGIDVENNNTGTVDMYTDKTGKRTRPDGLATNGDKIEAIHEHKHFTKAEDQVVYRTKQMEAQEEMSKKNGSKHIVTMSSDSPKLNGNPPSPRPSGPLAKQSDIYYVDLDSGKITAEWNKKEGIWEDFNSDKN